ncbi:ribosome biogenesis GTPase / thiamine phosphate phosphatase [Anaerolineae bacterium]|nr:ribosome biogenesis GTPase / thiamine phosphate phosphatase [Anaerolineae bacterium]
MLQPIETLEHTGPDLRQGIVFKKNLGQYSIRTEAGVVAGSLSRKLRKQLIYPIADPNSIKRRVMEVKDLDTVDPVAVGDVVRFIDAGDGSGLITEILPRRNKLSRPATDGARRCKKGKSLLEQVLVANIDQIVIVMPAANPPPAWNLLDRYLAAAEAAHLPAVICFTKFDLTPDEEFAHEIEVYRQIGYPVIVTSAVSGDGLDQVMTMLKDRVSVLWGKSGVGKTSLLNAIQPGLGLRVNEVNAFNSEGRHTTTHLEMFDLEFGGSVIDTPGQRRFKLWDDEPGDFAQLLPEMRPFIGQCKFGLDCTHEREPGCAIKRAVDNGQVSQRRYESLLGMRDYFNQ